MAILLSIMAIFVIAISIFGLVCNSKASRIDLSELIKPKAQVVMTDDNGNPIDPAHVYRYITYPDISVNIINAFVALEDKRFFSHSGIDPYRMSGALIHNIRSGKIKEGGSTITQQLAKNTLLTSEKTLKRKWNEIMIAKEIEKKYTKEEIMEMYLNAIYYGNGIYGIDSACYNYFNKEPSELSPAEGAILAGIVKNPSKYSPLHNPTGISERKNLVLSLMLKQGYITEQEYDAGKQYVYSAPDLPTDYTAPYFSNAIHEAAIILNISEEALIRSPYRIKTYYNTDSMKAVTDAFKSGSYLSKAQNGSDSPYATMFCDNKTGGILAYYSTSDSNVFTVRRSPGSTVKPILVYAPAIEMGIISEKTIINDEKISINGYSPKNFGDTYRGYISADTALAHSVNTAAVQVLQAVGIDSAKEYARKAGLSFNESDNHLALALGGMTYGVTLPELTEAYLTLAGGGQHLSTTFVHSITSSDGKTVYVHRPKPTRVYSSATSYIVTDMLKKAVSEGTARKLKDFPYEIAAKTGTAESPFGPGNSDAWTVAYTTEKTLTVWYGDTTGSPETALQTTGGNYPALLAAEIFRHTGAPAQTDFTMPETVVQCEIDSYALQKEGKLYFSSSTTPTSYRQQGYFSIANAPKSTSPYFDLSAVKFNVSTQENKLQCSLYADFPIQCRLSERNLMTGETTVYDNVVDGSFWEDRREKNAVYSYFLSVYSDNEFLGYTSNKLVFT